ncbi:MAG: carboxypeptidase regulatory-like domain-containing protein [Anaerolineae bacterium]
MYQLHRFPKIRHWLYVSLVFTLICTPLASTVQAAPTRPEATAVMDTLQELDPSTPPPPSTNTASETEQSASTATPNCALLDDPLARGIMSGALETALLHACGRETELATSTASAAMATLPSQAMTALGDDVLVNDPSGELTSTTQSGAVVAYNEDNGVLCTAYNDSYHGVVQGTGYTGFSSSTDGGVTWSDHGSLNDANSNGYPALVWRRADGHFYLSTLHTSGLGLWDLGTGCEAATWVEMIHTSGSDDKEMLAVDNNPTSPYYGRLYAAWTNLADGHIYAARSSDGGQIWSAPVDMSGHDLVNGAWPAVDPVSGDVYAAWTHWDTYPDGPIDVEMARSTDGGATWNPITNPMSDEVNPRDATASTNCGRPALNGDIRYFPYPQIAVDHNSNVHAVYSYDPDGYDYGDVVNVYYRRSTDQGATWENEIRVNDTWTWTDQFFPTLAVGETGAIGIFWYDRRLDSSNVMYDRYMALSRDAGITFEANQRISDESSPVTHDAYLATCYHGDYDGAAAGGGYFYTVWGDDRRGDADVWSDSEPYFWSNLFGTVYDANTMHSLPDAVVETVHATTGLPFSAVSDASGYYEMPVPGDETYDVTAQAYGYAPNMVATNVDVHSGQADIPLTPVVSWSISGGVYDANTGYPVYAHITVTGDPFDPPAPYNETWSDPFTGNYYLPDLAAEIAYTLAFEAEGYIPLVYFAGELNTHLVNPDLMLQPDLMMCTAPGYEWIETFYDGFESGGLGPAWSTTVVTEGRVVVSATYPYAGNYSVLLDDSVDGANYSLASLTLAQNLSLLDNVALDFWWREFDDENEPEDGVFISNDNATWYPAFSFNNGPAQFRNDLVDIASAAESNGLSLTNPFWIKFQFYDDYPIPTDGYAIDEVRLKTCELADDAVLQPAYIQSDGCPCSPQIHELLFANHTGADEEILLSYTASPGITILDLPATLGVIPSNAVQPFDVQVQIDKGVALNTSVYVTVTAYLASNPAISDTTVIEERVALLEAPWEWGTDAPVAAFYRGAGATLDDYAYVIGGQSGMGAHGDTARYRPDVGWQLLDTKPTPAANIDVAELNGKIYVAGGYSGGHYLSTLEVLDPSEDLGWQWATLTATLPISTSGAAMAAACDRIYLMGGNPNTDVATDTVYMYSPASPALGWQSAAAMPHTQRYASAVTARGLIFAMGDWDTGTLVQVYDCATDAWLPGYPQMNVGREAPGAAVFQNRYIVVYGGGPIGGFLGQPDVEYLDLDNLAAGWQIGPMMNQGRMGPGGGIAGGRLIAIGGYDTDGNSTNTVESIAFCPECGCGVAVTKDASADWVYPNEVVTYTVAITVPDWLTGTTELVDALPSGTTFTGYVDTTYGTAWYSPTENAVYWTRPTTTYSVADAGTALETFTNTWANSAVGLAYNPEHGFSRYVHEGSGPYFTHDVAYPLPHPVLHSFNLSTVNPGWSDWRSGIGYDRSTGHYFLADYGGGGGHNDNIIEIDPAGHIFNAWETAGTSNDSYDGSMISSIADIAVVPGTPSRYFATALFDGGLVYELNLLKTGQFFTDTWGTVMTCTVPGIADNAGIDYDAQNGVLYHSDWNSNAIVVTDLRCNVLETFTCGSPTAQNSGVTFIEGQWPPEVWTMDHSNNTTSRCKAVGYEPQPEVVTITYSVEAIAPVSTTVVNEAILSCDAPGCADPSALSILLLRTTNLGGSVQRALDELGYVYDTIYANSDWAGIDFAPYDVVVVGMDGGIVTVTSTQKIRTDVIDQGKRVIFFGGSAWPDFVDGVNQYLVTNNTAAYTWTLTTSPHFTLIDPAHSLAQGLPASQDFVNGNARYYQLRVTDPAIEVVAQNGDGYPSYFHKSYSGGGDLVWFIHTAYSSYWSNPADYGLLKQIVANTLARPRQYVTEAAFHIAAPPAITWTKEIYVNGNYVGRYDEGLFTVVPGDDVQIVDRLDYVGAEPLFVQLAEDWGSYPVTLVDEYHTRGAFTDNDWYVTLLPGTTTRLVKTLHVTEATPAIITEQLLPDGMPVEERTLALQPPGFTKDGPAVAYNGQLITYTLTINSQDPLMGSLWLTDALPSGVEYAYGLSASYGYAWYDSATRSIHWYNNPASSVTQRALSVPEAGTTSHIIPVARNTSKLLTAASPWLALAPSDSWYNAAPVPQGAVRYASAQCPGEPNRFYIISGVFDYTVTEKVWRYDADTDVWTELAPIPEASEGPSAVCYQGHIYVAGGGGGNQFYIYDIVYDTWTAGPSLPRGVWGAAMGAWNGQLFLAGGDNNFSFGEQSDEVDIYNIAAGTWITDGATMPTATSAPGWTQVDQYLYVVGGWGDSVVHNITTTQRYNMAYNYWDIGPTFISGRGDFVLAATDQYLYAIGGDADGGGPFDAVTLTERLDYTNWYGDTWTDISDPLPEALSAYNGSFCTTAKSGGEIWSVSGLTSGSGFTDTSHYRPSEPCVEIPSIATITFNAQVTAGAGEQVTNTAQLDDHGFVLAATSAFEVPLPDWEKQVNDHSWAPGLFVSAESGDLVTVTDVVSTGSAFTLFEAWDIDRLTLLDYEIAPPVGTVTPYPWVEAPVAPFEYKRFDAEYSNATGHVYMLGGRLANDDTSGRIWEFDPATGIYTDTGVDMPYPVSNYNIARLTDSGGDEVLVIFGGRQAGGVVTDVVQGFYPVSAATVVFSSDPYPVATSPGGVAVVDNVAYVFGGFDAVTMIPDTYIFDITAPAGSRWTVGPSLNQARSYIGTAVADGVIYAIGGDDFTSPSLIPLTITEKLDTANPVAWDDMGVADMPVACGEMQAFGLDTDASNRLAGSVIVAGCGQWPSEYTTSLRYDIEADSWDESFPNLNQARRNHAGAFIPAGDGVGRPGLWVWGGRQFNDANVLTTPEYYDLDAGLLRWDVPAVITRPLTLTKVFEVLPGEWTQTMLTETLSIGTWSETRPVGIGEPSINTIYLPLVLRNYQ